MNIANKLTVLRIALMPIMIYLLYKEDLFLFVTGFILAILIGFTDLFDGYLARKYHIVTDFGKFLDPVADKVFIVSLLLLFLSGGYIPTWFFMIILIREFVVTDFRLFAIKKERQVNVSSSGKLKAMFQFIFLFYMGMIRTVDLVCISKNKQPVLHNSFVLVSVYIFIGIVSFFTIKSMVEYLWENRELISDI